MPEKASLKDFLAFKAFISRTLIMIVYCLGAIWTTVAGVLYMLPKRIPFLDETHMSAAQILIGLAIIIIGNLVWRIVCEAGVVIFSIQDDLRKIERRLEAREK